MAAGIAAALPGAPCDLTVSYGKGPEPKRFSLAPGAKLRIGRSADCEIYLDLPGVSARHAELFLQPPPDGLKQPDPQGAQLLLIRDSSRNGTGFRPRPAGADGKVVAWDRVEPGRSRVLGHGWQLKVPLKSRTGHESLPQLPESVRTLTLHIGPLVGVGGQIGNGHNVPGVTQVVAVPGAAAIAPKWRRRRPLENAAPAAASAAAVAAAPPVGVSPAVAASDAAMASTSTALPGVVSAAGVQHQQKLVKKAKKDGKEKKEKRKKDAAPPPPQIVPASTSAPSQVPVAGISALQPSSVTQMAPAPSMSPALPIGKVLAAAAGAAKEEEEESAIDQWRQQQPGGGIRLTQQSIKEVSAAAAAAHRGQRVERGTPIAPALRHIEQERETSFLLGGSILRDMSVSPISEPGVGMKKRRKKTKPLGRESSQGSQEEAPKKMKRKRKKDALSGLATATAAVRATLAPRTSSPPRKRAVGVNGDGHVSPPRWDPSEVGADSGRPRPKAAKKNQKRAR